MAGWWFARNLVLYGDPLAAGIERATLPNPSPHALWSPYFRGVFWDAVARSFVGNRGWMNLPLPGWSYAVHALVWSVAAAGLAWRVLGRRAITGDLVVADAFVVCAVAALVVFNLSYTQGQGRYLFPALGSLAVLFAAGIETALAGVRPRSLRAVMVVAMVSALVAVDVAAVAQARRFYGTPTQYGDAIVAREGGGAAAAGPNTVARCGAALRTPPSHTRGIE